jgi:hypothetical protein
MSAPARLAELRALRYNSYFDLAAADTDNIGVAPMGDTFLHASHHGGWPVRTLIMSTDLALEGFKIGMNAGHVTRLTVGLQRVGVLAGLHDGKLVNVVVPGADGGRGSGGFDLSPVGRG